MDRLEKQSSGELKPYFARKGELSVEGLSRCVLWGYHVAVPLPAQEGIVNGPYSGHIGMAG